MNFSVVIPLKQGKRCHPEFISGSFDQEMLKQVQHDIVLVFMGYIPTF